MIDSQLKFIDEKDVPTLYKTKWSTIFNLIPKGKALVLTDKKHGRSGHNSLLKQHQQGRWLNLNSLSRGFVTYIINKGEINERER